MKMHDLGPKIAYLQKRPREAPPPLFPKRGLRPGHGGPQIPRPPPSPNFDPANPKSAPDTACYNILTRYNVVLQCIEKCWSCGCPARDNGNHVADNALNACLEVPIYHKSFIR